MNSKWHRSVRLLRDIAHLWGPTLQDSEIKIHIPTKLTAS